MRVNHNISHLLVPTTLSLVILLAASCKSLVLEDRRPCPGNIFFLLTKTLSNPTASMRGVHAVAVNEDGRTERAVSTYSQSPDGMILNVGFGNIDMYAYTGTEKMNSDSEGIFYIKEGGECCDSIYTYHRALQLYEGTFTDEIKLYKQFATLTVNMPNVPDIYTLWVKGANNGINVFTLDLYSDGFESQMKKTGMESFSCRMLRQGNNPIVIEVRNVDSVVQTIKVSEMIQLLNYDWNKQNLDDCLIILNRFGKFISGSVLGYIDSDFIIN